MNKDEEIISDIVAHIQIEQQNTHKEFKKVAEEMILEYIKKYNKQIILHGFYALQYLINNYNIDIKDNLILPTEDNRYYQCYSMKGPKTVGDLIKNLNALHYQPVRSIVTHTRTGSAKCKIIIGRDPGLIIIEITSVNFKEYNNIQKMTNKIDNLCIVNPLILEIESLNNILNNVGWDTNISLLSVILNTKLNPFKDNYGKVELRGRSPQKIIDYLVKKWRNKIVFIGDYVFTNIYLRTYEPEGTFAIMTDIESAKKISEELMNIGKSSWKLYYYGGTSDLIDNVYSIKDGKKILIRIHISSQATIPYIIGRIGKYKNINIANYLLLLRYYSSILLSHKMRSTDNFIINRIIKIINSIIKIRNNYLLKNKLIGIEKESNIFRILDTSSIELDSELVVHNKKLWEYKKRYGTEGYNQIKRLCQPLLEDL